MNDRDGYPHGVPCWVDTSQPDPEAAVAFYGGLFGWEFVDFMPPDAPGRYYMAQLDGCDVAAIGSQPEAASPAWNTYIWVDSADDAAARAKDAGGRVPVGPFDVLDTPVAWRCWSTRPARSSVCGRPRRTGAHSG